MSHKIIQLPSFTTVEYQNKDAAVSRLQEYISTHREDFVGNEILILKYEGEDGVIIPNILYFDGNYNDGLIEIPLKKPKKNIELDIEPTHGVEDRVDVTEIFGDQFSYETADNYIINNFALLSKEGTPDGWCRCVYGGFYAGDPKDGLGYRILEVMYFIVKEENGNIYAELIDNRE